jgi:Uma2 family endonuclease
MSGASLSHNTIVLNLGSELRAALRPLGCRALPSDMRIFVPDYPPYRYPDLTALCGKLEIKKMGNMELLTNPQLIVEVLSDTTEAFDRGDKYSYYKSIPSFTEYLLVAQHRPHVSQFIKQGERFWKHTEYNGLEDVVSLALAPCEIRLNEIYREVEFTERPFFDDRINK